MTPLKRLPLWRGRLEAMIDAIQRAPLEWGATDCGPALAGGAVEAITGVDLCARWRGRYHDEASAFALLKAEGFDDLADLVASLLPEIHPSQARIGDIAAIAVDGPLRHALGVVAGERILVYGKHGLATVALLSASRAFRVGEAG